MPRLTTVTIKRFKQLRDLTLPLDDITLLIGANNSGKSSLLQAIHFAVSVAQSAKLVGEGVAWAADRFQLSFNPAQLIYSPAGDVMALATGGTLQEGAATRVEIDLTAADGSRCVVGLRRGRFVTAARRACFVRQKPSAVHF
jgi:recombinational DNA repair ATPase RecF